MCAFEMKKKKSNIHIRVKYSIFEHFILLFVGAANKKRKCKKVAVAAPNIEHNMHLKNTKMLPKKKIRKKQNRLFECILFGQCTFIPDTRWNAQYRMISQQMRWQRHFIPSRSLRRKKKTIIFLVLCVSLPFICCLFYSISQRNCVYILFWRLHVVYF